MTAVDEKIEEQGTGRIDTEYEQVDEINGDVNVQITENDTRNEEERQMITDILEIREADRWVIMLVLRELTEKCWQNGRRR